MEESGIVLVLCFCGIFSCTRLGGNWDHWSVLGRRTEARSALVFGSIGPQLGIHTLGATARLGKAES